MKPIKHFPKLNTIQLIFSLITFNFLACIATNEYVAGPLNSNFESTAAGTFDLKTLQMVQIIYRHGDRTPLRSYPNDPYKDHHIYWPLGWGQLTEKGKDQHFDLGIYFRQRYDGFLNALFNPKQMHVLSSDSDRTLMSAEANSAGLFPKPKANLKAIAGDGSVSVSSLRSEFSKVGVQTVPIHMLTPDEDNLIKMTAPCPKRDRESEQVFTNSSAYIQLAKENREFINFIEEKFGVPHSEDIFDSLKYHDTLLCQKAHNMTLPSWVNDTVMEKMGNLRAIEFSMLSSTTELRRLQGGPLVQRLMKNMLKYQQERRKRKKSRSKLSKLFVHSGHDDTLAAVMSSMGVFDTQLPPYASAFIVELHQNPNTSDYFVHLFFRNSTSIPPYPLQIPGCELSCPWSKLSSLLEPVIPLNWKEECQEQTSQPVSQLQSTPTKAVLSHARYNLLLSVMGIIVFATLGMIAICFGSYIIHKLKLKEMYKDSYIPM